MFQDNTLRTHLETSSSVHGEALILAEINMNDAENFEQIGNYRYRPTIASPTTANFGVPATTYDANDVLIAYTGATDSDVVIDGGVDTNNNPVVFTSIQERKKLIFSLEECFYKFRPRSGINKAISYGDIVGERYGHHANPYMMSRPRYYISDKEDKFKYWTSYRQEESADVAVERGISNTPRIESGLGLTTYYIDDAVPFVVYKEKIPVNRIILKMQTHVGTAKLDSINVGSYEMQSDPLFDDENDIINRTVPIDWKIQYLEENTQTGTLTWQDAVDFGALYPNGKNDGVPVIPRDGYVELHYGKINDDYAWYLNNNSQSSETSIMNKFDSVVELGPPHQIGEYEQFMYIRGLRIVVKTMSKADVPFELIELSPRLAADLSPITSEYKVSKVASDLGVSGLPVGQLLASVGSITIADYDQVLNTNNQISSSNPTGSVIANFVKRNLQVKFYEIIKIDLEDPETWYYIPIKTMYAESFPEIDNESRVATIQLRDLFFYFESTTAPEVLFTNVSLSYAIATIMDSIGYSNYIYKLSPEDKDPIIPFFFVAPNISVAEVLEELAIATQTAMFFDEYNNFVLMSKKYIMPSPGDRQPNNPDAEVDMTFYGTQDFAKNGILKNELSNIVGTNISASILTSNIATITTSTAHGLSNGTAVQISERDGYNGLYRITNTGATTFTVNVTSANIASNATDGGRVRSAALANIKSVDSANKNVFNDGSISYTSRYIQKTYGEVRQASLIDKDKSWQYKPVLLWEIEPTENSKSINEESANQSAYVLSAIPLNSNLSNAVPTVVNNEIINNVLDLGEGVYWIPRYNGYFHANGEMIKYDAVEYSIAKPLVGSELVATLTSGSNVAITTTRINREVKAGQKITKVSGTGVFASNTTVSSVFQLGLVISETGARTVTTTITLSSPATTSGQVVFNIEEESSNVWISNVQEYQDYFAQIPFNGKMYPTGKVRIFTEPYYETYTDSEGFERVRFKNGAVSKHGRGQFATKINEHKAGIENSHWTNNDNVRGMFMDSDYLFNDKPIKEIELRVTATTTAGNTLTVVNNAGVKKGNSIQAADGSFPENTKVSRLKGTNKIILNKDVTISEDEIAYVAGSKARSKDLLKGLVDPVILQTEIPGTGSELAAGSAANVAKETVRTGIIKNFLSSTYYSEDTLNSLKQAQEGTVQSSALVMTGSTSIPGYSKPQNFISYIKKDLTQTEVINPKLFGTRMRIIGRVDNNDIQIQTPYGANPVTTIPTTSSDKSKTVSASSGGLAFMIDDTRNRGYFFEIAALTAGNIDSFAVEDGIVNVMFYKTMTKKDATITKVKKASGSRNVVFFAKNSFKAGDIINITNVSGYTGEYTVIGATSSQFSIKGASAGTVSLTPTNAIAVYDSKNKAVPYKLWEGLTTILVDDGKFVGQSRIKGEENTTVYDLAVEYEDIFKDDNYNGIIDENETSVTGRRFYLYINGKLIGTVIDDAPLPVVNNIAPFIRSTSKVMFEKIYAVGQNVANNGVNLQDAPLRGASLFNEETDTDSSFRKYSVENAIQHTYLSGISPLHQPNYDMYLEEFGTIMREAAYLNFRYEKAYPAFISKIAPTFNKLKGYAISGFIGNPYGAEFLVFNTTDFSINLDETSGNYLRILGVTFTQESDRKLTLDEYMKNKSDLSNPDFSGSALSESLENPNAASKNYRQIKNSRATYGKNEFSIASSYIQSADQAEEIMGWLIDKVSEPRLSVGLSIFPMPTLQLGDVVSINHKTRNTAGQLIDEVASPEKRFVVYNIEYARNNNGPDMTVYLSEVS